VSACAEGTLVTPTPGHSTPAGASAAVPGNSTDGVSASALTSASASESPSIGVVDESAGRYDDGLPKMVDGQQVLRDGDAIAHAKTADGSQPFYLGAWLTPVTPKAGSASPAPCPSTGCGPAVAIADKAGTVDAPLAKATDFHQLAGVTFGAGPAVLQVHSHDPAAVCNQSSCDSSMVVDAVIWSGDAATAPTPISLDDATTAISSAVPAISFAAIGSSIVDCGQQLPAATLLVAEPPADESGASAPRDWVASVSVAPSVDALNAALDAIAKPKTPSAGPGTENVFSRANLICRAQPNGPSRTFHYLIVDNVALVVATPDNATLPDRVFLQGLETALEQAGAPPTPSLAPSTSSSPTPSSSPSAAPHKTPKPSKKP
jgi:hypothetical protein